MTNHLQANSDWARENRYEFHADSAGPFAQVARGMDVFRRAQAYRGHVVGQHRGRPFEVFDFQKEATRPDSWSTWHTVVLLPLGNLSLPAFALWPRRETVGMNFLGIKGLDLTLPPSASLFDRQLVDDFNRHYSLFVGGAFGSVQAAIEAPGQTVPDLAEMSAICKPGVLSFLSAAVVGAIEVRDGYLVVCAPETRLVRPANADVILQGAERERLLAIANDLLDALANAAREAPLRDLAIGNSCNPKHVLGVILGGCAGFALGGLLGVLSLFLLEEKRLYLIPLLAIGGALLGSMIGKRLRH
jgi:hypothetical protein